VYSDFSGENGQTWYRNIDKLIHHVNAHGVINLLYSTPSIYTAAKIATTPLPVRDEDVMPYFDDCHAVWSGYFSSRPALKHYVRDSSRVFQAAKQLQAAAAPPADMTESNPLYLLERAMGVTQHHDAVSGTSKQHVANDYARRLAGGRLAADQLVTDALATLTGYSDAAFLVCDLANVTICPVLEAAQPTVLVIYNQLAQDKTVHVRVPVGLPSGVASYKVFNSSADAVAAQLVAPSQTDADLRVYYSYSSAVPVQWLAFNAPNVPAMGYAAYFLQPSATRETPAPAAAAVAAVAARKLRATGGADTVMSNGVVSLTFDGTTGLLKTYANSADGVNTPLAQAFMWWNSSTGNYHKDGCGDFDQSSGAYIVSAMQCNAARARPALFARARPALFARARPALFARARPALFAPALSPNVFLRALLLSLPSFSFMRHPSFSFRKVPPQQHRGLQCRRGPRCHHGHGLRARRLGSAPGLCELGRADRAPLRRQQLGRVRVRHRAHPLCGRRGQGDREPLHGLGDPVGRDLDQRQQRPRRAGPQARLAPVLQLHRVRARSGQLRPCKPGAFSPALVSENRVCPPGRPPPLVSEKRGVPPPHCMPPVLPPHPLCSTCATPKPGPASLLQFTALSDSALQMSIAVDRSQAGASLLDGSLELMVHRRILADDNRGVGEPHNETGLDGKGLRVRGVHRLDLSPAAAAAERLRTVAGHMLFREHLQFATNKAASPAAWVAANKASYSMLRAPLPANLHVVTLHAQSPTMALLRVAHMFAAGEGALAAPVSVDLATMFAAFTIVAAEEMILPGTVALTSAPVSTFTTRAGTNYSLPVIPAAPAGPGLTVTLDVMQIRTFRCQIAY
jgi:hypothetical protein